MSTEAAIEAWPTPKEVAQSTGKSVATIYRMIDKKILRTRNAFGAAQILPRLEIDPASIREALGVAK